MYRVQNKALAKGKMARTATLSLALAAAVLAGCATNKTDDVTTSGVANDYRLRHPIVVSQNEVFEDIAVSSGSRSLSRRDASVVEEMARRFNTSGAKSLRIIRPVGSRNEHAAKHISSDIHGELRRLRVPVHAISHHTYEASSHGDSATIRLSFDALDANVESTCGQWPSDLSEDQKNENYHNHGCATQNNLAEMVANPSDLLRPRGQSPIDSTRRDNVINDWRADGN